MGAFDDFVVTVSTRLGRVLIVANGVEVGNELLSDVLAYAWEHWAELQVMQNPLGYLYRVSQSRARRYRRWQRSVELFGPWRTAASVHPESSSDQLTEALEQLPRPQRVAVLLVHGYNWSYAEVAEVLGVSVAAVTNYVHRGMKRLRQTMQSGVEGSKQ
ncbi:MAG TPA: sigma-70 family RNA polymerase sigma factor [Acidimicrobiia bacterium]